VWCIIPANLACYTGKASTWAPEVLQLKEIEEPVPGDHDHTNSDAGIMKLSYNDLYILYLYKFIRHDICADKIA